MGKRPIDEETYSPHAPQSQAHNFDPSQAVVTPVEDGKPMTPMDVDEIIPVTEGG